MSAALLLCLIPGALVVAGCNDRTRDRDIVVFPRGDAGADPASDAADAGPSDIGPQPIPDPSCDGRTDGQGCELPNASGVCVRGACQLVACTSGFLDCDDDSDTGCETDGLSNEDCGRCGEVCEGEETCQIGAFGATCAVGIVCPSDRYDLDADRANGCEWRSSWLDPVTQQPASLRVSAAHRGEGPIVVAGSVEDAGEETGRYLVELGADAAPLALQLAPGEAALAAGIDRDAVVGRTVVAWSDGVSVVDQDEAGVEERYLTLTCEPDGEPRRYVGALLDAEQVLVASNREVVRVDPLGCDPDGACDGSTGFGPADYLRAFYPYPSDVAPAEPNLIADAAWAFGEGELALCDSCILDSATASFAAAPGCLGPRQCRAPGFDADSCGGCQPIAGRCPDFRPVAVATSPRASLLYVATRRGLLGLIPAGDTLLPAFRLEVAFTPDSASGLAFVGIAVSAKEGEVYRDLVYLIRNDGLIRPIEVRDPGSAPAPSLAGPDFALELTLDAAGEAGAPASFAAVGEVFAATDGALTLLARPLERSARSVSLSVSDGPSLTGLQPSLVVASGDDLLVLYETLGQLYPRVLSLEPVQRASPGP